MLTTVLRSIKELYGYTVRLADGVMGNVLEFYIDDEKWTARRVRVSGGVFLPAELLEEADPDEKSFFIQSSFAEIRAKVVESCAGTNRQWRPASRLLGLLVHARNGAVGKMQDIILNDADLSVRYLVVDAPAYGQKFILSPWWIKSIDLERNEAHLRFDLNLVLRSPKYDFQMPFSREREAALHGYYDKQTYWA